LGAAIRFDQFATELNTIAQMLVGTPAGNELPAPKGASGMLVQGRQTVATGRNNSSNSPV